MAVNKVVINGQTKIDLSGDTVTQADVIEGKTFHDHEGVQKTGSFDPSTYYTAILKMQAYTSDLFGQTITITKVTN